MLRKTDVDVLQHHLDNQPIWDGNQMSKKTRKRLTVKGYLERVQGMALLSPKGVLAAIATRPYWWYLKWRGKS